MDNREIAELTAKYPNLAWSPRAEPGTWIAGLIRFQYESTNPTLSISDAFKVEIWIPDTENTTCNYPRLLCIDSRLPSDIDFHIPSENRWACLGSPARLTAIWNRLHNLNAYVDEVIVPFLAAVSHKLDNGGAMPFGELSHGVDGLTDDYEKMTGMKGKENIIRYLRLLLLPKKLSHKEPCPCECGRRFGKCKSRHKLINPKKRSASKAQVKEILVHYLGSLSLEGKTR